VRNADPSASLFTSAASDGKSDCEMMGERFPNGVEVLSTCDDGILVSSPPFHQMTATGDIIVTTQEFSQLCSDRPFLSSSVADPIYPMCGMETNSTSI